MLRRMDGCPTEDELGDLAAGQLPSEVAARMHDHVRGCESCSIALGAMAEPAAAEADDVPAAGERVGRFELVRFLGAGGMGAVWEARDTELNRRVALKTLKAVEGSNKERLLREARAMAALSHPNVVAVYEVVADGDRVFLAMELVAGGTLRDWLRAKPRKLDEIVDVFVEAGKGLAVAHAAGLVHRDFKPENVLVDPNLRVRVTDFGLARASGAVKPEAGSPDPAPTDLQLTRAGALLGTPAYMAPEQMRGEAIDARADVFGFSTAFHEAVYGVRPFAGKDLEELRRNVESNQVAQPPEKTKVPAWLRKVLLRGLKADPRARWESMDTLLAALAKGRQEVKRRRRLGWAAAGVAVAAVIIALGVRNNRSQLCKGAVQKLAGVWDGARREQIKASFEKTHEPFSNDAFKGVDSALAAWSSDWVAMRTEACEATRLRGEQSEELLDLRMQCLDQRLAETRDLTGLYAAADASLVIRAVQAARALTPLSVCADQRLLHVQVREPADPAVRAKMEEVQTGLAQAKAFQDTGQYKAALANAEPAALQARLLGYRPLLAEALSRQGLVLSYLRDSKRSAAALREAALASEAASRDDLAASDWSMLILVAGEDQRNPGEALQWADHAEVAIARLGGGDDLEATREMRIGSVLSVNGRHDEAIPHLRLALSLAEKKFGPDSPSVGVVIEGLADGLARAHKNEESLAEFRRALPLSEKEFGLLHPSVARLLINMSSPLMDLNRPAEAEEALRRAMTILGSTDGPGSYLFGSAANNLGDVLRQVKKPAEAEREYRRGLSFYMRTAPNDPYAADSLMGIGGSLAEQHRPAEGIPFLEQALKKLDGPHASPEGLAQARFELARALWDSHGDRKRARALAEAAVAGYGAQPEAAQVKEWLAGR
jgi:eukaryotic-like serine/threonine-protein kinase